jgi:hypothetical protein
MSADNCEFCKWTKVAAVDLSDALAQAFLRGLVVGAATPEASASMPTCEKCELKLREVCVRTELLELS